MVSKKSQGYPMPLAIDDASTIDRPFNDVQQTAPVPRIRNRAAREQALIAAARKLFATRGYEASTTREIASEAGCAEGLIHRYFKGKAGLLVALIQTHIRDEMSGMAQRLTLAPTLREEVMQLVELELDRMWSEREFLKVVFPRSMVDPTLARTVRKAVISRRAEVFAGRLTRFSEFQRLPRAEADALVHFLGVLGIGYGFLRPVVLGEDRQHAREGALAIARMLTAHL
jgi:AcrR family transcriptional regulator